MGVVTTLLKQVPAAAKFKSRLEAIETELATLRAENLHLREELAQYLEQWETLDGPQVSAMQYLAQHATGGAPDIAKANAMNIQIAETSLRFLADLQYVQAATAGKTASGKKPQFQLAPKGERYLRERGLDKWRLKTNS